MNSFLIILGIFIYLVGVFLTGAIFRNDRRGTLVLGAAVFWILLPVYYIAIFMVLPMFIEIAVTFPRKAFKSLKSLKPDANRSSYFE